MILFAQLVHWFFQLITLVVIVQVLLSYFVSPFHPIRLRIDKLVNPILEPIRRFMPQTGMVDFSPLILIILIQILDAILRGIILSL